MQEPYKEGIASHLGPESCAGGGNAAGEALTGVHAGQVLSSEISSSVCRPCSDVGKAIRRATIGREPLVGTAESKTLCMCGNSMRENRETPKTPLARNDQGRSVKAMRLYDRRVRLRGVGRPHSTCEAGEQSCFGSGGARGGKGVDQGERPRTPPRRTQSRNRRGTICRTYGTTPLDARLVRQTRGRSPVR